MLVSPYFQQVEIGSTSETETDEPQNPENGDSVGVTAKKALDALAISVAALVEDGNFSVAVGRALRDMQRLHRGCMRLEMHQTTTRDYFEN